MKTVKLFFAMALMIVAVAGCKKEETKPVSTPLSYSSLNAETSTIAIGATTKVTASATGEGLSYTWSASAGDIIGSGSQITYGAPTCCAGQNTVTCIVKDSGGNQASKSITINVQ